MFCLCCSVTLSHWQYLLTVSPQPVIQILPWTLTRIGGLRRTTMRNEEDNSEEEWVEQWWGMRTTTMRTEDDNDEEEWGGKQWGVRRTTMRRNGEDGTVAKINDTNIDIVHKLYPPPVINPGHPPRPPPSVTTILSPRWHLSNNSTYHSAQSHRSKCWLNWFLHWFSLRQHSTS